MEISFSDSLGKLPQPLVFPGDPEFGTVPEAALHAEALEGGWPGLRRQWMSSAAAAMCGSCHTLELALGRRAGPTRCWNRCCRICAHSSGSGARGQEKGSHRPLGRCDLHTHPNTLRSLPTVTLSSNPSVMEILVHSLIAAFQSGDPVFLASLPGA